VWPIGCTMGFPKQRIRYLPAIPSPPKKSPIFPDRDRSFLVQIAFIVTERRWLAKRPKQSTHHTMAHFFRCVSIPCRIIFGTPRRGCRAGFFVVYISLLHYYYRRRVKGFLIAISENSASLNRFRSRFEPPGFRTNSNRSRGIEILRYHFLLSTRLLCCRNTVRTSSPAPALP
jgi:hypothetical protein